MSLFKILKLAKKFEYKIAGLSDSYKKEISQEDGFKITTDYGYIDYRPVEDDGDRINEIWYVKSETPGGGTKLVDLMMQENPANAIAWGVTSYEGEEFMKRYHKKHPDIQCITGPFEGQFDPYQHPEEQVDEDWDENI